MKISEYIKSKLDTNFKKICFLILFFILTIAFVLIFYHFYNIYNIGIPCIFKTITGYDCPGCGLTRANGEVIKFNFKKALEYNSSVFIVLPLLIYYFSNSIYAWLFDKKKKELPKLIIVLMIIYLILHTIIRNLV